MIGRMLSWGGFVVNSGTTEPCNGCGWGHDGYRQEDMPGTLHKHPTYRGIQMEQNFYRDPYRDLNLLRNNMLFGRYLLV